MQWSKFFKITGGVAVASAVIFQILLYIGSDVLEQYHITWADRILASIAVAFFMFCFSAWIVYSVKKFKFFIEH